ncbi:hypothetical protein HOD84_04250, partial [bacterium]|nr:hypothetical protein [bacterium]
MNKLITKYFYFILLSGSSLLYSQNYSLSFDGNDQYVNLGYSANFDLNDATISIWFKSDWNTPDPDWTGLFGRHDNWAFAMQYNYDTQNTRLSFQTGPSVGVSDNVFTPDEIPINDGRWHHALVTRNASSGTFKLYFDGVFIMDNEDVNNNWEAPSSALAGTVTSNYPLLIGKHHPGHNRTASGFVDDIAIWDKELNDAQIQQLFNQESPTSIDYSNLTGYWNFESGSGSTVYDQTSYQNNGEIINNATWSTDVPVPPVFGCTDTYADNFNSEATSDDGSCSGYPENGEYNLVFDGVDDFVEIDNNSIFTNSGDLTNNFTINLSFKKYNNPQDFEGVNLFSAGDGTVNGKRLSVYINNDNTIIVPLEGNDWITNHVISENTWTDLSLTYSNGIMKLYINGFLVDETNQYTVSIDTSSPLRIGSNTMSREDEFFHGHIDDVVIWDRYLSESEIEYFTFGVDSLLSFDGIVASYRFNSGSGDLVYDRSGGQSHGDISGATWHLPATPGENNSLSFDGSNDYVSIVDDQSLTGTSMMTISAWFKKVTGPGWMSLVGKGTSDANEEYILMLKDDQVYFDVGHGGGPYLQQSTAIDSETWHHIAAVHTRSNGIST